MSLKCSYCAKYQRSTKISKQEGNRICETGRKVTSNSRICDEFEAAKFFFCTRLNFSTCLTICNNRRSDKGRLKTNKYCEDCAQYSNEIKLLILM